MALATGLSCANATGDCHLLVVQGSKLYEAYRANASGGDVQAQCLALWRLDFIYPDDNRGEHCTSADAAGFPIAPLLFNADEVFAAMQVSEGDLGHAIRFILPNARMASASGTKICVHPATAESDRFTSHTWAELGINSRIFGQAVPTAPVRLLDFTVKTSELSNAPISFDVYTDSGTASAGTDYASNALVGKVIAAGQSATTFPVTIHGDTATR